MTLIMSSIIFWVDRQRGPVNTRLYKTCSLLTGYAALMVFFDTLFTFGIIENNDFFQKQFILFNLIEVPMFAIILKDLTNSLRVGFKYFSGHFLPFISLLLLYLITYAISTEVSKIVYWTFMLYVFCYVAFEYRTITRSYQLYESKLEDVYVDTERRSLKWLKGVLVPMLVLLLCYIITFVGVNDPRLRPVEAIVSSCIWLYIGYLIHRTHYSPALRTTQVEASPFELLSKAQESNSPASLPNAELPSSDISNGPERAELEVIIKRLRQHLDTIDLMQAENLTREDLARAIGTNHIKLSKALRQVTGMTLSAFVNDFRMTLAARLLKTSTDTIEQIIFQCGFNTRPPFYRAFQAKYGCTPKDFRERNEANSAQTQD